MINHNKLICNIFLDDNDRVTKLGNKLSKKTSQNRYPNIYAYIQQMKEYYGDCDCYKEVLIRMKYNIDKRPVCKTCGGHVTFNIQRRTNGTFFPTYCNASCQMKDPEQMYHHQQVCISRYGTNNNMAKNYETKFKRYGDKYYNNGNKRDKTNIERFGSKSPLTNPVIKQKTEETNQKRYGFKYAQSNPDVRKRISESNKRAAERKSKEEKKLITHKAAVTKSERGYISKDEAKGLKFLRQMFGEENVISAYFEYGRYENDCDYYIKTFDIFIELQANHALHGTHAFDPNNPKDLERLQKLFKAKEDKIKRTGTAKGYEDAIRIWTYEDPRKREEAKRNKLRFFEFWSEQEMEDAFNKFRDDFIGLERQIAREGIL